MRSSHCKAAAGCLVAMTLTAQAMWVRLVEDGFTSETTNLWSYAGVSNAAGQALMRCDAGSSNVAAEWDQSDLFAGWPNDPYAIVPSRLGRGLGHMLTDRDTFRFGATLNIATGSVPDTTEYHQIANIGLYDLAAMGPDRTMSDNFSGNTNLLKDGSDFIEFNYFVGNDVSWGYYPSAEVTIGAHISGLYGDYYFNYAVLGDPLWHSTSMTNRWLPEGTNLYIEVVYHGTATNASRRRARGAIYTDPERTSLLVVNGVEMYYWTIPLPEDRSFRVTDAAFFNHVGANWSGGPNAAGRGTFDDLYVDLEAPPGGTFAGRFCDQGIVQRFATQSGTTYSVEYAPDLGGPWSTSWVIVAESTSLTLTNDLTGGAGYYRVSWPEETNP